MALTMREIQTLSLNPFDLMGKQWFLVSAGTPEKWNTMTAGWGNVGVMWGKPLATAFVRQSRYTHEFMDANDTFTLTFLQEGHRDALQRLGSKSGRDIDKMHDSGLTPLFLEGQPTFAEAKLVLVCRKKYIALLDEAEYYDKAVLEKWYADRDMHTMYMGEIIACYEDVPEK